MTNSPLQPRALRYSYRRLRMPRPYTARRLLIDVPPPSKPISDVPDPPCEEPPIPLPSYCFLRLGQPPRLR